jgi:hypothetical protein
MNLNFTLLIPKRNKNKTDKSIINLETFCGEANETELARDMVQCWTSVRKELNFYGDLREHFLTFSCPFTSEGRTPLFTERKSVLCITCERGFMLMQLHSDARN